MVYINSIIRNHKYMSENKNYNTNRASLVLTKIDQI